MEQRDKLAKTFREINYVILIVCSGLIITIVQMGSISIAVFASGVEIALTGTSLAISIVTTVARRTVETLNDKQKNHKVI